MKKTLIFISSYCALLTLAYSVESQPAYIKTISDFIEKNPNHFFTYWTKGTDKDQAKYVSPRKNPKTGKLDFSVSSGGSYPAGSFLVSLGKPVSFLVSLYDDNPRLSYETILFHFTLLIKVEKSKIQFVLSQTTNAVVKLRLIFVRQLKMEKDMEISAILPTHLEEMITFTIKTFFKNVNKED
ncbi:MAG: hypothetical protein HOP07_16555 [Bacteriovoracaceae bacterium]|nr:hypothetical protein [Bacteriovoracaceae bacterium]